MSNKVDLRVSLPKELRKKAHIQSAKTETPISEKVEEALQKWAGNVELEEEE